MNRNIQLLYVLKRQKVVMVRSRRLENTGAEEINYVIMDVTVFFTEADTLRKLHCAFSRQLYPMHAEATGAVASQTSVCPKSLHPYSAQ